MQMNQKIAILACFLVIIAIFFVSPRLTLGAADNSTINVTIQSYSEITVSPDTLKWEGVYPGQNGGTKLLDIKNTGSINVSQIYGYVSTLTNETSRPYGYDDSTKYASTGLIVMRNESGVRDFFAGRIEWNWTEDISNKVMTGIDEPVAWGFVRNASQEYFWGLGNGSENCSSSDTDLGFNDIADNGSAATRTTSTTGISHVATIPGYGIFNVSRSSQTLLNGSCVAVDENCTYIYLYKYDKRSSPNFASCTNVAYIQAGNLVPKDIHTVTLDAYAPLGIPQGILARGVIYIIAS